MSNARTSLFFGTVTLALMGFASLPSHAGPGAPAAPSASTPTPTVTLTPVSVAPTLLASLRGKRAFDPAKLTFVFRDASGPLLRHKGKERRLLEANAALGQSKRATASMPAGLSQKHLPRIDGWRPGGLLATPATLVVDHRSDQTPIKDQGTRGTCSAFATVAGLEAMLARKKSPARDLSENHVFDRATLIEKPLCPILGVATWAAVDAALDGVCAESAFPYTPDNPPGHSCAVLPAPKICFMNADAKIALAYSMYTPKYDVPGVTHDWGHRADNVALLEAWLEWGKDVVFGVAMAGTDWGDGTAATGVVDVQIDSKGHPAGAFGGHAMLMVGYDHTNRYFIFKNSWNATYGHDGYVYVSFDYVQTYALYAFVPLE